MCWFGAMPLGVALNGSVENPLLALASVGFFVDVCFSPIDFGRLVFGHLYACARWSGHGDKARGVRF